MGMFGVSRKEAWKEFSDEIDAEYIEGGFLRTPRVKYTYKFCTIYLDTYTVSTGNSSQTYTRIRVLFINSNKFYFKVTKKHLFSGIGKAFRKQDIEIDDRLFDRNFTIKGSDEALVRKILQDIDIKEIIQDQPRMNIKIVDNKKKKDDQWYGHENILQFVVRGIIKDKKRLMLLFKLFTKILDQFTLLGITTDQSPGSQLYKE